VEKHHLKYNCEIKILKLLQPVPLVVRSEARTVLDGSSTEIVGSNPARGTDMSALFCVALSCAGRDLAMGSSPYQNVKIDSQFHNLILNRNRSGGLVRAK